MYFDNIEISSDSDRDYSDTENFWWRKKFEKKSDEEN